jgi:SAM-dependent methyltransferase
VEREEYRRLYELEEELWWFRGMAAISRVLLERFCAESSPSPDEIPTQTRVLDAGCGTGGMLGWLGSVGTVMGLDDSADAVEFASWRAIAPLVRGSVSRLPFRAASFDVVTSFDVLYHLRVTDDEAALAEISEVTKPGGTLLIRVPAYESLRSHHDEAVHTRQRYGRRELMEKLRRTGLEPIFVTFANCLLFPIAVVRRKLERLTSPRAGGSEVQSVAGPLNALLLGALRIEAWWLRRFSFPFGLSLVVVARKPARDRDRDRDRAAIS